MPRYAPYTTTVVGAHSVPRWYEALDRLVTARPTRRGRFRRCAVAGDAGRHPRAGDRRHRRDHGRRDASPHAQSALAAECDAQPFLAEDPVISGRDEAQADHAARSACLPSGGDLPGADRRLRSISGLVDEFRTVSAFARKPVKITMTGPHLLAAVAYDEYYNDTARMMADFGKLLHQNFKKLAAAGCKHIQIDEPYFTACQRRARSARRSTSSTWPSRACPRTCT